jgi:hypothetical protein
MPTDGSVPYTWTIYANDFRVADKTLAELGSVGETGKPGKRNDPLLSNTA